MKTIEIKVKIPEGAHCTGCPLNNLVAINGLFLFGCNYLHDTCQPDPDRYYLTAALKHPDCPQNHPDNATNII